MITALACSPSVQPAPAAPAAPSAAGLRALSSDALAAIRREEPTRVAAAKARLEALRPALGLDARSSFELVSASTDAYGQTHARFAQRYAGLPVFGAQAVTHTGVDGAALAPTLELAKPTKVATQPALASSDAIGIADRALARKGDWSVAPKAELVLYPVWRKVPVHPLTPGVKPNATDFRRELARLVLAWHVHTELENAQDGVRHTDFIVDARTGETIHDWSSLETGVGNSQYNGVVTLGTVGDATNGYALQSPTMPHVARNMNMATSGSGTTCTDADDVWGDGTQFDRALPADDANGQTAAVDATYAAEKTWAFYGDVMGRDGIDGYGSATFSRVHYGNQYDNAFWSNSCFCMTYGDGSGRAAGGFDTLTSIDIIGHEFSHGVTSTSAGLVYDGESGGLNESTSDIFGAMVEFYARGGGNGVIGSTGGNWEIGEQIADWPLRWMDRPSDDGLSPDAWFPGISMIDVHYSSGPMNRAFYFLSQGASADPTARGYSEYLPAGMTGVGNDVAAAIWYRALTTYLTPTSDYVAARTAALRAAADFFGRASPQFQAVRNAFAAVNVGYADGSGDDLTAPTVTLAVTGRSGAFHLTAAPTDNGAMERVDFYLAGTLIGTDTSAPYVAGVDALLGYGPHDAFAVAYDAAGNYGVSDTVAVDVTDAEQLLANPGFEEDELSGWSGDPILWRGYPEYAFRGTGFAYLGGYGAAYQDTISQTVAIPAGASAQLAFHVNVVTDETAGTPNDTMTVTVLDETGTTILGTLAAVSNLDATGAYVLHTADLSAYAGSTVTLQFQSHEDAAVATAFFLDEVSVRASTGTDVTPPVAACQVVGTRGAVTLAVEASDDAAVASADLFVDGASAGTVTGALAKSIDSSTLANGNHTFAADVFDAAGNKATCQDVFFVDNSGAQLVANPSFESYTADSNGTKRPNGWTWFNTRERPYYARTGSYSLGFNGYNLANFPDAFATCYASQAVTVPASARSAVLRYYLTTYSAYPDGLPHDTFTIQIRDATDATTLATPVTWRDSDWPGGYYGQVDLSAYAGQTIAVHLESTQAKSSYWSWFWVDDVELFVSGTDDLVDPAVALNVYGNSGVVGFSASATDNVGIGKIDVYVDDVLVDTTNPLFPTELYTQAVVPAGAHVAKAVATDLSGRTGLATVAFDTLAPPEDHANPVVSASAAATLDTVTLSAAATDDLGVAVVEFYVDGTFQGRSTVPPYGIALPAAPFGTATHTVIARAYDAAEKVGVSAPVLFAVGNHAPVASAGTDASVNEGGAATLHGSATDEDGDALTFGWTQVGGPAVTLSSATAAEPTFTAPIVTADTALTFRVTVADGRGLSSSDEVTITVVDVNHAPVANAGADQSVAEGATATLQGSATDEDGDAITYAWSQTGGPTVALSSASAAQPTFTAPLVTADTTLSFRLTVSDPRGGTSSDDVTVTVTNVNHPPVANAGADQSAKELTAVTLTGSGTDPDGDTLTYAWTQTSGPSVALTGANGATATFTAPEVSTTTQLGFALTVTDSHGASSTDSVVVTVTNVPAKKKSGGCSTGGDPSGVVMPLLGLLAAVVRKRRTK